MNIKPWAIRVASRPEDGAGHVMRGAALAHALAARAPVSLVLDDAAGDAWIARLAKAGIAACLAGTAPPETFDAAILDGYHFSDAEFRRWRDGAGFLAVIDDFPRPPPIADLVVNVTPGLGGDVVDGIPALLGPRFALLGPAYGTCRARPVSDAVAHVLVSLGAQDAANASALALEALARVGFRPKVTVVLGASAPHKADIRTRLDAWGGEATLVVDTENMPDLYGAADLVIGAGGVGLLERMACGVPSVSLIVADNQRAAVAGAAAAGATDPAGSLDALSGDSLARAIRHLADDPARRRDMATAGRRMVDGRGAARVAERLIDFHATHRGEPLKTGDS